MPLGLKYRDLDEVEIPMLQVYNEFIEMTFDEIFKIDYEK